MNSKNVFGQPRLRASLRDLRSPRRAHKSTIEDDLKKLIIMDNPAETSSRDAVSAQANIPCSHRETDTIFLKRVCMSPHSLHIGLCSALSQMRVCAAAGEIQVMQAHHFLKDRSSPATCSSPARCLRDATATTSTTVPSCQVRKVRVLC